MAKSRQSRSPRKGKQHTNHKDGTNYTKDDSVVYLGTPSGDPQVDFEILGDNESLERETPVDFSISKDLVSVTKGGRAIADTTIGRQLAKMSDLAHHDPIKLQQKRIVYQGMEDSLVMNAFREIRTRLLQKSDNRNFVLMVTAVGRDMGATFTTVNLGAAFSYEGEKTALLIDCHPKAQDLGSLLEIGNSIGLCDYVNNPDIQLNQVIYPTGIKRMRLVPFGSAGDSGLEILSSQRMKDFIQVLKKRYTDRFIIMNAPPLEVSADAAILSQVSDYVLVVVPYGGVSNNRIKKAIKSIPSEKIAGVILNNCKQYV